MPQFSPMSWVIIAFFLVGLMLLICVGVWWEGSSYYSVSCFKSSVNSSRLLVWGKSSK
uniref:ATP synthase F0 subunit 8 n=1 Tax=Potomida littoralis TaxID=165005 RepID=A0A0U2U7H7_9BIVA|nr:ATP synthase F0 subunit 8 [Potomida littoralis]